jgi:hypothetical protein
MSAIVESMIARSLWKVRLFMFSFCVVNASSPATNTAIDVLPWSHVALCGPPAIPHPVPLDLFDEGSSVTDETLDTAGLPVDSDHTSPRIPKSKPRAQ